MGFRHSGITGFEIRHRLTCTRSVGSGRGGGIHREIKREGEVKIGSVAEGGGRIMERDR